MMDRREPGDNAAFTSAHCAMAPGLASACPLDIGGAVTLGAEAGGAGSAATNLYAAAADRLATDAALHARFEVAWASPGAAGAAFKAGPFRALWRAEGGAAVCPTHADGSEYCFIGTSEDPTPVVKLLATKAARVVAILCTASRHSFVYRVVCVRCVAIFVLHCRRITFKLYAQNARVLHYHFRVGNYSPTAPTRQHRVDVSYDARLSFYAKQMIRGANARSLEKIAHAGISLCVRSLR